MLVFQLKSTVCHYRDAEWKVDVSISTDINNNIQIEETTVDDELFSVFN